MMWNLVLLIKKKKKKKVFDSTGVMKTVELLEIEKSGNITFYTALSESCSQTLFHWYVLLFCTSKPSFFLFTDSISEIFDVITVTFKNENLLGVTLYQTQNFSIF